MGRTTTPTFRVEHRTNVGHITAAAWDTKRDGRPTNAAAAAYRAQLNASLQPGGCNNPDPKPTDVVMHVTEVRVYRNATNVLIASDHAPMFEVA